MASIFDYLSWRGDLTFSEAPFNEVDNLILAQLTYLDFTHFVGTSFDTTTTIEEAASCNFSRQMPFDTRIYDLLKACAVTDRFKNVGITGYVSKLNEDTTLQFAAETYLITPKLAVVAFRGTDRSITGWKEDCYMAFTGPVQAQTESVTYLDTAAEHLCGLGKRKLIVLGHSKGGNEALYSSAFCKPSTRRNITTIYNDDGPGFDPNFFSSGIFTPLIPITRSFVPEESVVGMLLEREEPFEVVEASSHGIAQHDPFNWHVMGSSLVKAPHLSTASVIVDGAVRDWLLKLTLDDRREFVDTFFAIIENAGIHSLNDVSERTIPAMLSILKSLHKVDPQSRDVLRGVLVKFVESVIKMS